MDPKKAPGFALVVHAGAPKGHDDGGDDADPEQGKLDAADALIEAIKAGDKQGVSEALSAHYDICASEHDEPSGDDDSGGY